MLGQALVVGNRMDSEGPKRYYRSMIPSLREEAARVAQRLREELGPSAILLFGSVARGSVKSIRNELAALL